MIQPTQGDIQTIGVREERERDQFKWKFRDFRLLTPNKGREGKGNKEKYITITCEICIIIKYAKRKVINI